MTDIASATDETDDTDETDEITDEPDQLADLSEDVALLRESQDRTLRAEGIPMVLALMAPSAELPPVRAAAVLEDGRRLADRLGHYRATLLPELREQDQIAITTLVLVTSYSDFGRAGGEAVTIWDAM